MTPKQPYHERYTNGKLLYQVGGLAAWITALIIPIAVVFHAVWPPPPWAPGAAADWFVYIQDNRIAGLVNLDVVMEIGLVLSIVLYMALYVALRQTSHSLMAIATTAALLGTLLHLLSNTSLEMLMLSDAHAVASTDTERAMYLAAGEAALSSYYGMIFHLSYVLGYLSYIAIGVAMLRSTLFTRMTANLAILTGITGFGFYLPTIGLLLSVLVVLLVGIWNIMVGIRLLQLVSVDASSAADV